MGVQEEIRLSELAKRINEIDKRITKTVTQGDNPNKSEEEFRELRDEVKQILGNSSPIRHRDPQVRKILQKVRDGNYFYVDKKERDFLNFFRNFPPEALKNFREEIQEDIHKILSRNLPPEALEEAEKEIHKILKGEEVNKSESYMNLFNKFIEEIHGSVITPDDYFERKKDFSTIIVASPLPPEFLPYYEEIRLCFIFRLLYAAVGLCRVLIELSFRDKYNKLGFSRKKESPNVYYMDDHKIHQMINAVCTRLELKSLKDEAIRLYGKASTILHGRESTIKLDNKDVLQFIRSIFKLIETLYT